MVLTYKWDRAAVTKLFSFKPQKKKKKILNLPRINRIEYDTGHDNYLNLYYLNNQKCLLDMAK